jgi:hypothetical protein
MIFLDIALRAGFITFTGLKAETLGNEVPAMRTARSTLAEFDAGYEKAAQKGVNEHGRWYYGPGNRFEVEPRKPISAAEQSRRARALQRSVRKPVIGVVRDGKIQIHRLTSSRPHAISMPRRREARGTRRRTAGRRSAARSPGSKPGDEPHPGWPLAGARVAASGKIGGAR